MGEGGLSELGHFYTLSKHDNMFWILDDSNTKGPFSWSEVSKIASGENNKSTSAYMLLYSKGSEPGLDRGEIYVPSSHLQQLLLYTTENITLLFCRTGCDVRERSQT